MFLRMMLIGYSRFSDFQVNEITEDGSVLHLSAIGLGNETNVGEIAKLSYFY